MRIRSVLAGFAVMVITSGCDSPTGPEAAMLNAHVKWLQQRPATYSFVIRRWCECSVEGSGPVRVVVQNGTVASRTYVATGATVPATYDHLWPSIDGLFAHAAEAARGKPDRFVVTYDPHYGYPAVISVDQVLQVADDEYTYEVTDLAPFLPVNTVFVRTVTSW